MAYKVYITRKILEPAMSILSKKCKVTLNRNAGPANRAELLINVAGKDGILCMLSDRIDAQVMDLAGPNLQVVSS